MAPLLHGQTKFQRNLVDDILPIGIGWCTEQCRSNRLNCFLILAVCNGNSSNDWFIYLMRRHVDGWLSCLVCWLLDFNSVIQTEKPPEVKTLPSKANTQFVSINIQQTCCCRTVKNSPGQKSEAEMLFVRMCRDDSVCKMIVKMNDNETE